uniref:Uncharacterized protein n=1 Tax=Myotis myotis TaxID=51298 RepID=A0A7J7U5E4_MYOMY|nr:hypothetical protein mMyoMyo1_008828 [Myotis myotis]
MYWVMSCITAWLLKLCSQDPILLLKNVLKTPKLPQNESSLQKTTAFSVVQRATNPLTWIGYMKKIVLSLARWLSWLECRPVPQKVVGLILGQSTNLGCRFKRQPMFLFDMDVSLSLPLSKILR